MGTRPGLDRELRMIVAVAAVLVVSSVACADPATAQETEDLYRRLPLSDGDPFAHLTEGRGFFTMGARASAANNALSLRDLGAILYLAERDSLRAGDALDALGLVPAGAGLRGEAEAGGGLRIGVPVGGRLTVGLAVGGRGYGSFRVDDDAVALLRDGNGSRSEFGLGASRGGGLLTAEAGLHAALNVAGAPASDDTEVVLGAGLRHVRPVLYGRFRSLLEDRSRIVVAPDSLRARVAVAADRTPSVGDRGTGILGDLMTRVEWPRSGIALEATVRNLGTIRLDDVVRRREDVDLSTTSVDSVMEVVESLSLTVTDTASRTLSPPALVGLAGSVWGGLPMQVDGRLLVPVGGDLGRSRPAGEVLTTWRLGPLPLRAGVRFGGPAGSGIGGRLGLGVETGSFFLRASAWSDGGLGGEARGLAAKFDTGIWF